MVGGVLCHAGGAVPRAVCARSRQLPPRWNLPPAAPPRLFVFSLFIICCSTPSFLSGRVCGWGLKRGFMHWGFFVVVVVGFIYLTCLVCAEGAGVWLRVPFPPPLPWGCCEVQGCPIWETLGDRGCPWLWSAALTLCGLSEPKSPQRWVLTPQGGILALLCAIVLWGCPGVYPSSGDAAIIGGAVQRDVLGVIRTHGGVVSSGCPTA